MPTISELQAALEAAQKAVLEKDRASRREQSDAWAALVAVSDNWEWQVGKPTECREDWKDVKVTGVRVQHRVKPSIVDKWAKDGFSTFASDYQRSGQWHGMFYYRTEENILTHASGGTHVLRTPKLCSDVEWAEIVAGRIPEKFKRS